MGKFKAHSIAKTNELFYAGAVVVTNRLGVKIDKMAWRKEPTRERRLQNKTKELRKDQVNYKHRKTKILVILDIGKDCKENIALELKD